MNSALGDMYLVTYSIEKSQNKRERGGGRFIVAVSGAEIQREIP